MKIRAGFAAGGVLTAALLCACSSPKPVEVSIATAATGDMPIKLTALGTITPLTTVTVKAPVSGLLVKVGFTEGQMVQEGDFLAQVDPSSAQVALDRAEGMLKRDQAALAGAQLELQGAAPLQVDRIKTNVATNMGRVATDEVAVTAAKLKLDSTRIVAPVMGRVGLRQVDQGNYVTPADADGIVVITALQPMSAIFILPEDQIGQLSKRLAAGATLPAVAFPRDCDATCLNTPQKRLAEGRLQSMDNQIDVQTGTVKLRAVFDNKERALFPQQSVNVVLRVDTLHNQVLIPTAAVKRGETKGVSGEFVYVVDTKTSTVSARAVKSGVSDGDTTAIVNGLAAGEVVVTGGGDRLTDGAKVLVSRPVWRVATR